VFRPCTVTSCSLPDCVCKGPPTTTAYFTLETGLFGLNHKQKACSEELRWVVTKAL
jgi:hypothetical protein